MRLRADIGDVAPDLHRPRPLPAQIAVRVLKVRVRARPIDGEANDALIRLLAKSLGVSKSSVTVVRGGQSRSKMLLVDGLDDETLGARIAEVLSRD